MDKKDTFRCLGLMSGTSLDGLDIAFCVFEKKEASWSFSVEKAQTIKYSAAWKEKLSTAHKLDAEELLELDHAYGAFLGKTCKGFLQKNSLTVDFIASHGHTIFHQPEKRFTYQLGNGNDLHAFAEVPVIWDFRSLDVALNGEGAPLVPAGDKFLFSEYDVCLNLGGIANLSMDVNGSRVAFDICFCNMGLNYLAAKSGKEYDKDGQMAEEGEVNKELLKKLDSIYKSIRKKRPSIGREMFEKQIKPLIDNKKIPVNDRMRTLVESAAKEIISAIGTPKENVSVLCTGGGAFNRFMMSRLLDLGGDRVSLILPDENVIKFKEAMVFAFLGVLRARGEVNCLESVTRATRDSSSGVMLGF
ncbi:MAG TPA: anhydro-N-acetylmuramic acid kinase [Chryseosolibacter sp.]